MTGALLTCQGEWRVLTSVKAPAIICAPRHAEEFVMKWCAVLSCVAGMLLSLSALATAQGKSLDSADQTDTAAGKRIFDAQCAWCHGTDGVGGTGSTLQGRKLRHAADDAALIGILKNGIPGTEMPAFRLFADRRNGVADSGIRAIARPVAATTGSRQSRARRSDLRIERMRNMPHRERPRRRARSRADCDRCVERPRVPPGVGHHTRGRTVTRLPRRARGDS